MELKLRIWIYTNDLRSVIDLKFKVGYNVMLVFSLYVQITFMDNNNNSKVVDDFVITVKLQLLNDIKATNYKEVITF